MCTIMQISSYLGPLTDTFSVKLLPARQGDLLVMLRDFKD